MSATRIPRGNFRHPSVKLARSLLIIQALTLLEGCSADGPIQQTGRPGAPQVSPLAVVTCLVGVDGATSNCRVIRSDGPPAFTQNALTYATNANYRPAARGGAALPTEHTWTFRYTPPPSASPAATKPGV